jgi:hypothetical protein
MPSWQRNCPLGCLSALCQRGEAAAVIDEEAIEGGKVGMKKKDYDKL